MTGHFHQHTLRDPEAALKRYCPPTSAAMRTSLKTAVPFFTAALLPPAAATVAECPVSLADRALGLSVTCRVEAW